MSRAKSQPSDANLIAQRWYEAKAKNPSLTQAEFVRRAIPSYHVNPVVTKGKNKGQRKTQKQIDDSRARYLRLNIEGKRTGTKLIQRSNITGPVANAYQARIWLGKEAGFKSVNIVSAGNRSTLDIFRVESNPNFDRIVGSELRQVAAKYPRANQQEIDAEHFEMMQGRLDDYDEDDLPIGAYEVVKIRTYKKQPVYLTGSE